MMDYESFRKSIEEKKMPVGMSVCLQAMWYDANGDWRQAHSMVDDLEDTTACWVHAYLHRKEPDIWNADYWYRRAGKKRPDISLDEEWGNIVTTLLSQ
jgi:hypothetical protein